MKVDTIINMPDLYLNNFGWTMPAIQDPETGVEQFYMSSSSTDVNTPKIVAKYKVKLKLKWKIKSTF